MTSPITPAASLLTALGTTQATAAFDALPASDRGLFDALLKSEIEAAASILEGTAGATGTAAASTGSTATGATTTGSTTPSATQGGATTASTSSTAGTGNASTSSATSTGSAGATTTPTAARGREYVVTYIHGQTPISTGPTPAPFVTGATGKLLLTAKTTYLTQITPRFTGTAAHPTAAALATATTMAIIDHLKATGQV